MTGIRGSNDGYPGINAGIRASTRVSGHHQLRNTLTSRLLSRGLRLNQGTYSYGEKASLRGNLRNLKSMLLESKMATGTMAGLNAEN